MIHFDGGNVSGRLKYDFLIFLRIFVHMLSLSPYICSYAVTIGVYLYICCQYCRTGGNIYLDFSVSSLAKFPNLYFGSEGESSAEYIISPTRF